VGPGATLAEERLHVTGSVQLGRVAVVLFGVLVAVLRAVQGSPCELTFVDHLGGQTSTASTVTDGR
jgi:hypothetical protein